jgi:hypothetical protein
VDYSTAMKTVGELKLRFSPEVQDLTGTSRSVMSAVCSLPDCHCGINVLYDDICEEVRHEGTHVMPSTKCKVVKSPL